MSAAKPSNDRGPGRRVRLPEPDVVAVTAEAGEDSDDRLRKIVSILLGHAKKGGQVFPEEEEPAQ